MSVERLFDEKMDLLTLFAGYNWIALLCILAGIVFVIIEMNLPGFSIPGIIGVILLAAGVIIFADTPLQALILIIIILAILGAALLLVLRFASKSRLSKHLILEDSVQDDVRFSAGLDLDYYVGSEGTATSALRPSGTADFSGVKVDVVSSSEFIPKNSTVIITKIEGNRVVVKQKPEV